MSATRTNVSPDLSEARRLLGAGMKLVEMEPLSKRPKGIEWNKRPANSINPNATGYGLMLAQNKLCSVDPDNVELARIGLKALGFDLDAWMDAGVQTRSTRKGSGGRSTFAEEGDLAWIKFAARDKEIILELRADSPNLQDCVPGIVYRDKAGNLCTQQYANCKRLDEPPALPDELYAWWQRCSTDIDFLHDQQQRFCEAIGREPNLANSLGKGEHFALAYAAPGYRGPFNRAHKVEDLLERHGYTYDRRAKRWTYPGATGAPGIYPIPGKDGGLWRSDHGGDPLSGAFDAWTVFVVLEHGGDVAAAIRARESSARFDESMRDPSAAPSGVASNTPANVPTETKDPGTGWLVEPLDFLRQGVGPAFDLDDVPPQLGRYAIMQARAGGFDPSAVIAATVAAAAASLSDGLRLCVSSASDYYESARLWVLLIAPPGAAKSPALAAATKPIKAMHRELFEDWQRDVARLKAKAEASGEDAPELPPKPALFTSDATVEALAELLANNERGLLVTTEEFESWIGGHDAYRSGGSKDRGEWLRAYDGGPHQVDRVKRGSFYVQNWGVSILTATTPSVLQKLSRKLPADGLLQRFVPILVQPVNTIDREADAHGLAQGYHNTLARLLEYGPRTGTLVVTMTHEADELMFAERERLRDLAVAVGVYGDGFAGHVAKHAGMLARIALLFHALVKPEHPAERKLEADTVRLASRFMRKVFRHSQVLYGELMGREGAVGLARGVASVVLADSREFVSRRDLARSCHAWRTTENEHMRDEAMNFLVDMGWLRDVPGDYQKPYATRWAVNPGVHERFASYGEKHREARRRVVEAIRGDRDE